MLAAVKAGFDHNPSLLVLIFEDQTGRQVDFDLRGTVNEVVARALPAPPRSGPGRPKLALSLCHGAGCYHLSVVERIAGRRLVREWLAALGRTRNGDDIELPGRQRLTPGG